MEPHRRQLCYVPDCKHKGVSLVVLRLVLPHGMGLNLEHSLFGHSLRLCSIFVPTSCRQDTFWVEGFLGGLLSLSSNWKSCMATGSNLFHPRSLACPRDLPCPCFLCLYMILPTHLLSKSSIPPSSLLPSTSNIYFVSPSEKKINHPHLFSSLLFVFFGSQHYSMVILYFMAVHTMYVLLCLGYLTQDDIF